MALIIGIGLMLTAFLATSIVWTEPRQPADEGFNFIETSLDKETA